VLKSPQPAPPASNVGSMCGQRRDRTSGNAHAARPYRIAMLGILSA
jgi:hypothetical protein